MLQVRSGGVPAPRRPQHLPCKEQARTQAVKQTQKKLARDHFLGPVPSPARARTPHGGVMQRTCGGGGAHEPDLTAIGFIGRHLCTFALLHFCTFTGRPCSTRSGSLRRCVLGGEPRRRRPITLCYPTPPCLKGELHLGWREDCLIGNVVCRFAIALHYPNSPRERGHPTTSNAIADLTATLFVAAVPRSRRGWGTSRACASYASRAVQFHPHGGQFGSVRSPARTTTMWVHHACR